MALPLAPTWEVLTKMLKAADRSVSVFTPFYTAEGIDALVNSINDRIKFSFWTRLKLDDWVKGVADPEALLNMARLLEGKLSLHLRVNQNLHAKAYFFDMGEALVGSANLTGKAFSTGVELMVKLDGTETPLAYRVLVDAAKPTTKVLTPNALAKWVEKYRPVVERLRERMPETAEEDTEAEEVLDKIIVTGQIPIPDIDDCDRFFAWLMHNNHLAGASMLCLHATDKEEQRRQGHFRKCFGAVYRFLHAFPGYIELLARWVTTMSADSYFKIEGNLLRDWKAHFTLNKRTFYNDVTNYITLYKILPTWVGGRVTNGGGAIGTFSRMVPLVALYIQKTHKTF